MREVIDGCKWIYLRHIGEPKDNSLQLIIEEAKDNSPAENVELVPDTVFSGLREIKSDASCRTFELIWTSYVAYSVRNESFCAIDKEEIWEGRLFCLYSKSHFLNYIAYATFACADYPGTLQHWGINCLDHIVDVVSTVEPQIREIYNI
jgi:hypothetical protein